MVFVLHPEKKCEICDNQFHLLVGKINVFPPIGTSYLLCKITLIKIKNEKNLKMCSQKWLTLATTKIFLSFLFQQYYKNTIFKASNIFYSTFKDLDHYWHLRNTSRKKNYYLSFLPSKNSSFKKEKKLAKK